MLKKLDVMLQSFTGVLENGHISWEEPQQLPKHAKVVVTVLEEIVTPKTNSTLAKFAGIWANLPEKEKQSLNEHLNTIRNEWERPI